MSEFSEQVRIATSVGSFWVGAEALLRWFAIYTTARHEKHVSELLAERQISYLSILDHS